MARGLAERQSLRRAGGELAWSTVESVSVFDWSAVWPGEETALTPLDNLQQNFELIENLRTFNGNPLGLRGSFDNKNSAARRQFAFVTIRESQNGSLA